MSMKILHLDMNHPLMIARFNALGFENHEDYASSKSEIEEKIADYDGLIIRSRFTLDRSFLEKAEKLKFIGRVGAGLENIDTEFAREKGIYLAAAPEGNRNAVGEHSLGMLLSLFNKLHSADREVRSGKWRREENRGLELDGKTVGIIGYGNMGKAFARKLRGFDVQVICLDIKPGLGDDWVRQVELEEFQDLADVVSLHVPQTDKTVGMVNSRFIAGFRKPFWLLNTARGKCVETEALVAGLTSGRVLGAGLDVLEYEKSSFESLFEAGQMPAAFKFLVAAENVILSPHVAGWTVESKEKLAQTIVDKIATRFSPDPS